MGLFRKRTTDPSDLERLREEIARMAARLDENDAAKSDLGVRVEQVAGEVNKLQEPLAARTPEKPAATEADIDMLRARIERLSSRMDTPASTNQAVRVEELAALREQMTALHEQLTAAPSVQPSDLDELRQQLVELGKASRQHHTSTPPSFRRFAIRSSA